MHERDRHAALADGGRDALHRAGANVAAREDARDARLQEVRVAVELPALFGRQIRAREDEAAVVERDLGRQPRRLGIGPDEDEEPARLESRRLPRRAVADLDRLE